MSQPIIRRPMAYDWDLAQIRAHLATMKSGTSEQAMLQKLSDIIQQCERTLSWYGSIHQYVAGTSLSGTRAARVLDDAGERARATLRHMRAHAVPAEGVPGEHSINATQ